MTRVVTLAVVAALLLIASLTVWQQRESDDATDFEGTFPVVTPDASPTVPALATSVTGTSMDSTPPATPSVSATSPAEVDQSPSVRLAYFHIAPTDGLAPESLAQQVDLVTLTRGDEAYRDNLRASGFDGPILQYVVASEVNGPGPYRNNQDACDASFKPRRNGLVVGVGEFCQDVHPHEDWFLHNGAGDRLYTVISTDNIWYHMNPGNAEWRSYAQQHIVADLSGPTALGYDGIFLDNVELSIEKVSQQLGNSDGTVREYADNAAYREAWVDYLAALSDGVRPDAQLWGDLISDPGDGASVADYLISLDGAMLPAFATGYHGLDTAAWESMMSTADEIIQSGKSLVAVSRGTQDDIATEEFSLASYLTVSAGGQTFFRYVSNQSGAEYTEFWTYPNYGVQLGAPLGPRYRTGVTWRRDFQCGYVSVNPSQQTGQIFQTTCEAQPTPTPAP
jgi:hypothetical protein